MKPEREREREREYVYLMRLQGLLLFMSQEIVVVQCSGIKEHT
jgi:hypothetical protein